MEWTTRDEAETRELGRALGRLLRAGDVVTLSGEMGAGKTVLAQGLGLGLDVEEPVSSPTFALVHEYRGRVPVWHLDTYRIGSPEEVIDLSWQDMLAGGGVVLVEWPERIAEALPDERLEIVLVPGEADTRRLRLTPHGARMREVAAALAGAFPPDREGQG